ncbi:AAA family ATPase [Flexivirga sp. ID2601S]|uniref:AAA family ATPase n=1 Tax=Flexivirga aerilata TaxID=1656889 RepID=A0A849AI45_9MICO|nr:AAA family ATPase [Flexivirga aerilata]
MTTCARCGAEVPDAARFCSACGAAVAGGDQQAPVRKHVVILFCDLVGSTALGEGADPEVLRGRLARYFDAVSAVIWHHGGTVEKFIGDAVMAVFGVPSSREDDGARAVRAAIGIHQAVAALPDALHVRIGVNSGEVFVTHQPDGQFSVTGDAVNTAQRLESAAGIDETYVGDTVAELLGDAVVLDEVGEILHKGKSAPQLVYRVAAGQTPRDRVREPAFVGRAAELADLASIADRSAQRRQGWLLTYVGDAGIGKSRMIREFARNRDELRVVVGRCDPMSTGAFAPLASWLADLAPDWQAYVGRLLGDAAPPVLQRLRSAAGVSEAQTSSDDVAWAVRQVLEALCAESPVVSVWDDLHWATEAQLDLLELLAAASRSLPVLTVCLSRPDLFEHRPRWGGGRKSRVEDVEPLDFEDMLEIAADRIAVQATDLPATAEDLVDRADGNPQVVQLLAQNAATGGGLPASVAQLYEAALDRLSADERTLVEVGSVAGREFALVDVDHTAALRDLHEVAETLRARGLLELTSSGDYRFSQSVLMQTAYRSMPKRRRAERHAALAADLETRRRDSHAVSLAASHYDRAHALLAEIGDTGAEREAARQRALATGIRALDDRYARGESHLADGYQHLATLLHRDDDLVFRVGWRLMLTAQRDQRDAMPDATLTPLDAVLDGDPQWVTVREAITTFWTLGLGRARPSVARERAHALVAAAEADPAMSADGRLAVLLFAAQAYADAQAFGECIEVLRPMRALAPADDVVTARVIDNFEIQVLWIGDASVGQAVEVAERMRADLAGVAFQLVTVNAILAAGYAVMGDTVRSDAAWRAAQDSLSPDAVLPAQFPRHYRQVALAARGAHDEAAQEYDAMSAAAEPISALWACGWAADASGSWIRAGRLDRARAAAGRASRLVQDAFAERVQPRLAVVSAVEAALRREAAAARHALSVSRGAVDRDLLWNRAESAVDRAIVETVLGHTDAAATAAEEARAAYLAKGATAMSEQVDTWLANAAKLRQSTR